MEMTVDVSQALETFRKLPEQSLRTMNRLIEGGAIDFQRDMRVRAPIHDGAYRTSVRYRVNRARLHAEIGPNVKYAEWVEKGSRPHWVSVKEGTPLRKWADDKGINPFALQHSIAKKGTKGQNVVEKTFNFNHRKVERDIETGFMRFVEEVNRVGL